MEKIWVKGEGILGKSRGRAGVDGMGINGANILGGDGCGLKREPVRGRGGAGSAQDCETFPSSNSLGQSKPEAPAGAILPHPFIPFYCAVPNGTRLSR